VIVLAGQESRPLGDQGGFQWSRQIFGEPLSRQRPVFLPRLRGRTAGLNGISGGRAAAASPRIVPSRLRASAAVLGAMPSASGRPFSHLRTSGRVMSVSCHDPHLGRMNRLMRYLRIAVVLIPTSWPASHVSIH
jgi:hypothetical protein